MPKEQFHFSHSWDITNKVESSINHDEWERQISRFLKLGFHTILGLPIKDYLSSMPRLQLPQDESAESFNRLVVVEPRIPPKLQLRLAGFYYHVDDTLVCQAKTSEDPYIVLLQANDGRNLRDLQAPDENYPTIQEGASILIAHPEVIDGPPIALLGSGVYSLEGDSIQGKIPCIYRWSDDRAGIGSDFLSYLVDENAQAATCTRVY